MPRMRVMALVVLLSVSAASTARADATLFIGAKTTADDRQVRGFSGGFGLLIVGFEFEYASTLDDPIATAPSLKTGSGNLLLQTPVAIHRFQPYFTTGGGFYSETLGARNTKGFTVNTGGGVKVSLAGPLRLRLDYRVFRLGESAQDSPVHRVYAGVNLKF